MAQPITFVPASADRQTAERYEDAISSALELLHLLHDRGVLNLLRGMVGAGDRLVDTLIAAIDTPEAVRAVRNFILFTKFFGSVPPEVLSSVVRTVMERAEREKAHRAKP
jgi:uncharacterized protein YjgD (DUF1641 family)